MIATILCTAALLASFDEMKVEAVAGFPMHAARITAMTATFGDTQPGADAVTKMRTGAVVFHERICGYPEAHRRAIAAHEIGHVIAAAVYPEHRIGENMANYFGAKLLPYEERATLLEHFATRCAAGSKDYCWLNDSWQYAFTH